MEAFNVPGMAIGIVRSGKVEYAHGFGVREVGKKGRVNGQTLFRIASNSKAFTTAALATLVDEGKIQWDGPVIDYVPEFRMHDPWVTREFTIIDLLTHRSGLAPFKGDLLLWPEPNAFTTGDIIFALRYFEPVSGFRAFYAYDNLMYIVAGEVIARVSGMPWGEWVEQRLMRPAGMQRCFAGRIPDKQMKNLAVPHALIDGQLAVVERNRISVEPPVSAPAGGVVCSLDDMLTWTLVHLNRGRTPAGGQVFSESQSREMWTPFISRRVSARDYETSRTHFRAYGLGWRLADVHGYLEVSHTGTLSGMRSYVVMIPELELGVVVLINGSSSPARRAVMNTIVRSFMPVEQVDWVQMELDERSTDSTPAIVAEPVCQPCREPDLARYAGTYRDPWFGQVNITLENGRLVFSSVKSPRLNGAMQACEGDRFIVRWDDRTLQADAWVQFEMDGDGPATGISMSKLDRGDYDFEDLQLSRVDATGVVDP
jgi:CubicO group peptidase (beta-lactamase class C family)